MTTTIESPVTTSPAFLSEIFPLNISEPNLICFRLTPEVGKEVGNRFSWRFSQKFPDVVVIWESQCFWVLGKPNQQMPTESHWKKWLEEIQDELRKDIGDRNYSIQWVRQPSVTASVLAELAVRALQISRCFYPDNILPNHPVVEVNREVKFWAETFESENSVISALALTTHSYFSFKGTLADFYQNHPYRQKPTELLMGLKVRDIEKNSSATIIKLEGTIGERKQELLDLATGAISKQAIIEAAEEQPEQPVVVIQFGKKSQQYPYAMAALRPCITAENADKFDVEYGELLKYTKISYQERQERLLSSKQIAVNILSMYGFKLEASINNRTHQSLFLTPQFSLEDTKITFGKNVIGKRGGVLKGLSTGGVYQRHKDYTDPARSIRIAVLKVGSFGIKDRLIAEIQQRLKKYGFESIIVVKTPVPVNSAAVAEDRDKLEKALDDLLAIPTDIVLTFLPESDRYADNNDEGSFYIWIYSRLMKRGIASQFIYEDTLKKTLNYSNILNQVIPGILAKLGNLPFVLAEPLEIADYFVGLDVSRVAKKKKTGSLNVCASVRFYGKRGEFKNYRLEDALCEGEEIDKRTLESFFPSSIFSDKKVLIYRDGRFCGDEIKYLLERAKILKAKFILVECIKSGIPRLYKSVDKQISEPTKGLGLCLSDSEVLLVTTHW